VTSHDPEPHLRVVLHRDAFSAWWWTVVLAAAGAWWWLLVATPPVDLAGLSSAKLLVVAFLLANELRPVVASKRLDPDGLNLAAAVHFAILLRWGIVPAIAAVVLATVVGEAARRKPLHKTIFNAAQYSLSYLAAAGVLHVGGWEASMSAPATIRPADLLLCAVAALTYHAVNVLLVGTAVAAAQHTGWWAAVTDKLWWYTRTTVAVLAIGPLIVIVLSVETVFLVLLILPIWLVHETAKLSLDRERRAGTDPLTGLANREQLETLLDSQLEELSRVGRTVALGVVDLDRFKEVNDTLGHATGDALLRALSARLLAALREGDAVVRLGGDEFVLLLAVEDREVALDVVRRLADHVHEPYDLAGIRIEVEMSVGVALFGEDGDDLETLLRRADVAMYEAKAHGEVVRPYRPEMEQRTTLSGELAADIRRGMAAGELELHYQPQVALPGGEVVGVEALVRWRHPERGLLLPGAFLPSIERTSAMRSLTSTVLELALAQCARWKRIGLHVPVSINASMYDLADSFFAERVTAGLRRHRLDAGDLRVEITEQALVGDSANVLSTLEQLDDAGVELSLDDFGTGHASLTRLARLPISEVKVDRQFVVDLEHDSPTVVAIVRSVLELAHAIGARTVAEGVETEAQWAALAALGCDAAQGWLTARAMPWNEATRWLVERADRLPGDAARIATAAGGPTRGTRVAGLRLAASGGDRRDR
jgi:diguanylate cyclase (GGDEF)-like protein